MILDKFGEFDPANTAITAGGASTNTLDMGAPRDISVGTDLMVAVAIQTTFVAAGAATLQVQMQGSVDNATWFTLGQSDAIGKAALTQGATINLKINPTPPQAGATPARYYRLNYAVGTGPFTAGQLQAELIGACGNQNNHAYAAGYSVVN